MSRVSDLYEKMITKIEATLTSYTRMPNPYEPSENPSLFMRQGFAVGFGPALNTERMVCDKVTIQRTMNVLLVIQVLSTEMNSSGRAAFEKTIMDDAFSLIKAFENDVDLTGSTTTIKFEGDSGIQYVEGDSEKYLFLETNFNVEYFENLT